MTLIDNLGTALLQSSWQFALIGLVLYLALQLIPNRKSQTRYVASCMALLACLLAFFGTLFWAASGSVSPSANSYGVSRSGMDFTRPLVMVWMFGSAIIALRNSILLKNIYRIKASAIDQVLPGPQLAFNRLASIMGVRRSRLFLSDTLTTPCTFGIIKPIVILPLSLLTQMPSDEIEAVLAHELAHIRRYDYVVNIAQQTIVSILYYHPVIHFINRQIDREREIACDDMASAATGEPRKLAAALGKLTLFAHGTPYFSLSALGCQKDVVDRMTRLVTPAEGLDHRRFLLKSAGTAIAAIAVLFFADLATAFDTGEPEIQLTATESAKLRDDICNQIKKDGYYLKTEFRRSDMVRVNLDADTITLNGIPVTAEQLPNYTKIATKYGLKRGQGEFINFNSKGSEIELGHDRLDPIFIN